MRTALGPALSLLVASLLVPACSSSSGGSGDPRCVAICTIEQPSTPGAGEICSQASADSCLELCGARVQGTTAACGDCLLEKADFSTGSETGGGGCDPTVACPQGECTESGWAGDCTYCAGDTAKAQACYTQTHPRREVACKTDFRDALECSALCAVK
jgi:hypothetical protein